MGKSKTIGNLHITINKKTDEEKREEREKLFEDINNYLMIGWLERSEVLNISNEKIVKCYRELIKYLYQAKVLNIPVIRELIDKERQQ